MLTHVVPRDHLLSFLGFFFVQTLISLKKVMLYSFQTFSFLINFVASTFRLVFLVLESIVRLSISFHGCLGLASHQGFGAYS